MPSPNVEINGKPFEIPGRAFLGYIDAVKDAPTKEPVKPVEKVTE